MNDNPERTVMTEKLTQESEPWKIYAAYLSAESGWSSCSSACAGLQGRLLAAEARIAELRGALIEQVAADDALYGAAFDVAAGSHIKMLKRHDAAHETCKAILCRTDNLETLNEMKAGYEARIVELLDTLGRVCVALVSDPAITDTVWTPGLPSSTLLGHVEIVMELDDNLEALAAHDKEVRKAALLEAAEFMSHRGWRASEIESELRRMAEEQ